MTSFRKFLFVAVLFLEACRPAEESRVATVYGSVEGRFAADAHDGAGVLWYARDGRLLFPFCSALALTESRVLTARHCFKAFHPGLEILYDTNYLASEGQLEDQLDLTSSQLEFTGQLQKQPNAASMIPLHLDTDSGAGSDSILLNAERAVLRPLARAAATEVPLEAYLYSYPGGKPLMITGPCEVKVLAERLYHDCDSLPGSSGGLLVDGVSGKAIGMHVQGAGSNNTVFFEEHHRFETRDELLAAYCESHAPEAPKACITAKGELFHNSAVDIRLMKGKDP